MNIGDNIKKLRRLNNMKQSDLSKKLNVSNKTVSSWECGRTEPRMGMIEQMCEIFHCKKDELIKWDSEAQEIIDRISGKLSAMEKPKTTFIEDIQKDQAFMDHIRLLFSLSPDRKRIVYETIQGLYLRDSEDRKKEKDLLSLNRKEKA